MYQKWSPTPSGFKEKKQSPVVKRRFHQFSMSLGCFLLVFSGQIQENTSFMQNYLPTNLQSSLTQLGRTFAEQDSLKEQVSIFYQQVLFPEKNHLSHETQVLSPQIQIFSPSDGTTQLLSPKETSSSSENTFNVYQETLSIFVSGENNVSRNLWSDMQENQSNTQKNTEDIYDFFNDFTVFSTDTPPSSTETVETMPVGTIINSQDMELPDTHIGDILYLGERSTATPVSGGVTSYFGYREDPITGAMVELHSGLDIRGSEGTPIVSWSDGIVEQVGQTYLVGNYIRIDHGDHILSFYAHCSEILVKEGDLISVGQEIAKVGATGLVTGPHLHFEIRWQNQYLNPIHYLNQEELLD